MKINKIPFESPMVLLVFFITACGSQTIEIENPGNDNGHSEFAPRTPEVTEDVQNKSVSFPESTEDIQNRLLTAVLPRIHGSYPSPDGNWEAQVIIYDCTSFNSEYPEGNSLEQLVLINLTDSTQTVIDSQFIYCGGLGASGLEGRFWTSDSMFFYYTSAREGVPDGGCGSWVPPLLRFDITDPIPIHFGSPAVSPDETMIAVLVSGQLEIWETSGGQKAVVQNLGSGTTPGSITWSPDNQSVAYILSEIKCLPGDTSLVVLELSDMEPEIVLVSENPMIVEVSWDDLNTLTLFDEGRNSWSFDLETRQLNGPNN